MSEQQRDPHFVERLLAEEPILSDAQYAEHRRRLDEKVAKASEQAIGRSFVIRRRPLIVATCSVLAVAAAAIVWFAATRPLYLTEPDQVVPFIPPPNPVVVLRPAPAAWACASSTPFFLEGTSDVVLIGELGDTFQHEKEQLLELHVDRVLKGNLVLNGKLLIERKQPFAGQMQTIIGCQIPSAPLIAPNMYRKGKRVLLYLTRAKEGRFQVLQMNPLSRSQESEYVPQIERFAAVWQASHSDNPKQAFEQCLSQHAGGVDIPACCALTYRPHAEASAFLLARLEELHKQALAMISSTETQRSDLKNVVSTLKSSPRTANQQKRIRQLWNTCEREWFRKELRILVAR